MSNLVLKPEAPAAVPAPTGTYLALFVGDGSSGTTAGQLYVKSAAGTVAPLVVPSDAAPVTDLGNISGTLDLSAYASRPTVLRATLTGNLTAITLPTPVSTISYSITLVLIQDGTGSRTLAWPSTAKTAYNIDPVLTTTAAAIDLIVLQWNGAFWYGFVSGQAMA